MRKTLFLISFVLSVLALNAQTEATEQKQIDGQIYYEDNKTLKEAYQYIYKYTYFVNPKTGEPSLNPVPVIVKHGGYISYRRDGSIEQTGNYDNNVKSGEWKTYDVSGKIIKKENF